MKTVNMITKGALALMCILILDACSKTKNNSAAQTPVGTTGICQGNFYTAINGQQVPCVNGQQINTAYTGTGGYNSGTWAPGTASCQQYTLQWGVQYVPVALNNQIQCIRYDLVASYTQGSQYQNQPIDYYYTYPIQASYYPEQGYTYNSGAGFYFDIGVSF